MVASLKLVHLYTLCNISENFCQSSCEYLQTENYILPCDTSGKHPTKERVKPTKASLYKKGSQS